MPSLFFIPSQKTQSMPDAIYLLYLCWVPRVAANTPPHLIEPSLTRGAAAERTKLFDHSQAPSCHAICPQMRPMALLAAWSHWQVLLDWKDFEVLSASGHCRRSLSDSWDAWGSPESPDSCGCFVTWRSHFQFQKKFLVLVNAEKSWKRGI